MMDKYQSQNFLETPENFGQSDLESLLVSASTVDNLAKDSIIMSII
jgi:hypothetical protein